MMLTLSQPHSDIGRPIHEYPQSAHPDYRYSPRTTLPARGTASVPATAHPIMSTQHRGLPPPSAMTLPDLSRSGPGPMPVQSQGLGAMPAPPGQWNGAEESMRNWLHTKAEEERRKQEEEKTRQESLRLEQRRIEQSILRDSMHGGVPPQLIPMIFAGIGGQNLSGTSVEWLQQYNAQLQMSQEHFQKMAEERRDTRSYPAGMSHMSAHAGPPPPPPATQNIVPFPAYTAAPDSSRPPPPSGPTSAPRSATHGLSRLTTVDIPAYAPVHAQGHLPEHESPTISFHHWVPPATIETRGNLLPTPSGKEPTSAHPSQPGDSDYKESPRKRKATGGHAPVAGPTQISPSMLHQANTRRTQQTHARTRSTKSDEHGDPRDPGRRDSVAASTRSVDEPHRFSRDAGWPGNPRSGRPESPPRADAR